MDLGEIGIDGETRFCWLMIGWTVAGFRKNGIELSGFMKKVSSCLTNLLTVSFSNNILDHGVSEYLHCILLWVKGNRKFDFVRVALLEVSPITLFLWSLLYVG
jgi:hypothetical protein